MPSCERPTAYWIARSRELAARLDGRRLEDWTPADDEALEDLCMSVLSLPEVAVSVPFTITQSWDPGWTLSASCAPRPTGGTDVVVTFLGVVLPTITLEDVTLGPSAGDQGFDDVRLRVQGTVLEVVARALRESGVP